MTTFSEMLAQADLFPDFEDIGAVVRYASDAARPPERLTVTEAAEKYRRVINPGSYVGPWRSDITPYVVEYQDSFASTDHTAVVFVGPAQCGKTDAFLNYLVFSALVRPMDLMLVEKTQELAKDFVSRRLSKVHEGTEAMREVYLATSSSVFFHRYRTGMFLSIAWPSKNTLSGRPIPHILLSDYDRMPGDVDGEGDPFSLARKRTTTFGKQAMTIAESSPSYPVEDLDWVPATAHEAPPAKGILGLYNTGDRRRWHWLCVKCGKSFEPDVRHLRWADRMSIPEAAEGAHLECPHCQAKYYQEPTDGLPGRNHMNRENARWLRDGQMWTRERGVHGDGRVASTASFWLKGPAAAFMTLPAVVQELLSAEEEYARTGNEEVLKAVYNTTLGVPYIPKRAQSLRTSDALRARAEPYHLRVVPPEVRFLIATIDVQGNRFEAGLDGPPEWYVIDRFSVKSSGRTDRHGNSFSVEPHEHPEDWHVLVREVLLKTYEIADGSGRRMAIRKVGCDSHGLPGVTANAYAFWRWLRHGPSDAREEEETGWVPGLHERFILVRGVAGRVTTDINRPRVQVKFPDAAKRTGKSAALGDVPVAFLNVLLLKDEIAGMVWKEGKGRVHLSDELPKWFFNEMTLEYRDDKLGWVAPRGRRNEAWDLLCYARGVSLLPDIRLDDLDWHDPPPWAAPLDANELVLAAEEKVEDLLSSENQPSGLKNLGELLA